MNRIKVALLFLLTAALAAGAAAAQDATLQEVLEKHYEAIGGLDAWQGVQSFRASGKMTMGPMEAPVTMTAKRPDKVRIDFTVQGMTGSQAYDGETAWMLMPFMGKTDPEDMPADQAKALKEEADIDGPLVGYEEEGLQLELVGLEEIEGTQAYKIKVTEEGEEGAVRYFYLESEYYVPIRVEGSRVIQGNTMEYETTLSDYKDVDGLMMAHSMSTQIKGAPGAQVITVETIEVNLEVDDSVFAKPAKKAEPDQK